MMQGLSGGRTERRTLMIRRRTALSLPEKKGGLRRLIGRTKGGMSFKRMA